MRPDNYFLPDRPVQLPGPPTQTKLEELSAEYAALRTSIAVAEVCDEPWMMKVTVGGRAFSLATTVLLPVLRTRLEELRTQIQRELC